MISWTDSGLTPEEFHQRMGQLRQQLVAGEPEELRRSYLAQPGFLTPLVENPQCC